MIGQIDLERPVLVVDDTNSTRYATRRVLQAAGVQVLEAMTGEEALALAPQCGAVLLDVNLPDMDGFEVCRILRADPGHQQLPVVHISAQRMRDEDKIRGLQAGADAYLTHPVDPGVLIATLNALLRARRAEHSEQQTRTRLEAVFHAAPVGLAVVSHEARLLDANAEFERLFGLPGTGDSLAHLPASVRAAMAEFRLAGGTDRWSVSVPAPDGEWRHLDCHATPVGPEAMLLVVVDNTVKHMLEMVRDRLLDSERAARAEAEASSSAKDAFLALLSHELRNPLAPISASAQLLQSVPDDASRVRAASEIITRQVGHMTRLVDDLMDVSRVSRGLVELDLQPLTLDDVVAAAVEQATPLVDARRHALHIRPGPGIRVHGDRTRLVQVVANLINNAAKYTAPGGEITVSVGRCDGLARVSVADNGQGIALDLLPNVFELFTQGERTPDRSQGGLGIGLALVRSVAQLHGGSVGADSAGPGHGSTFTVALPLMPEAVASAADDGGRDATADDAGHGLRMLVVDDNVDAATTLAMLLGHAGHTVDIAHGADDALRLAAATRFDAFVLDIGLPGMTGHELASRLRADARHRDAALIALTGYGQSQDLALSREAGFDHHLVKPVDHVALLALLSAVDRPATDRA